jgi:hypothetical protein
MYTEGITMHTTMTELILGVASVSEQVDNTLIAFNNLRQESKTNEDYRYRGKIILDNLNKYKKVLSNRIDKLTIEYNRELRVHATTN